jgi:hypothetical protein
MPRRESAFKVNPGREKEIRIKYLSVMKVVVMGVQ